MTNFRFFCLVNALSLLSVGVIIVCLKSLGEPLGQLFMPPVAGSSIEERLLTYIFQIVLYLWLFVVLPGAYLEGVNPGLNKLYLFYGQD
jgi:hypothetical protein